MKTKIVLGVAALALVSGGVSADTSSNKRANSETKSEALNSRTAVLEKQVRVLQGKIKDLEGKSLDKKPVLGQDLLVEMYAHGPALVTSPALGVRRSADDASDLMVNLSSINEDLNLLQLRQKMDNYAETHGLPIPERPIIAVSGGMEGTANYRNDYDHDRRGDINLSRAELDIIGEASPWATAAMIISYEDKGVDYKPRVKNSRLRLDRGFFTLGQLNQFPGYFTVGQVFAPFGRYGSYMLTDVSTKILGRVKDRMAIAGFYKDGLQAQIYGFSGETKLANKNFFHHTGFNLGYQYDRNNFKLAVSGGMIGNMAESEGMLTNIFGANPERRIVSKVPGLNGRIKANYGRFALLAEYVGTVKAFEQEDLMFNGRGARPKAIDVEGAVEFQVMGKPSTFAVGYGQTWQALALKLPQRNFFAEYNISIIKNTILSFEYRHDINYRASDCFQAKGGQLETAGAMGSGRHSNIFTTQLGIYF